VSHNKVITSSFQQGSSWEANSCSTNQLPNFYKTQRCITTSTRAYNWSISWVRRTQHKTPHKLSIFQNYPTSNIPVLCCGTTTLHRSKVLSLSCEDVCKVSIHKYF